MERRYQLRLEQMLAEYDDSVAKKQAELDQMREELKIVRSEDDGSNFSGESLRKQYADVFGKIQLDDESFETISGRVQRDLLQNIGVIPNEGMVAVKLKRAISWVSLMH